MTPLARAPLSGLALGSPPLLGLAANSLPPLGMSGGLARVVAKSDSKRAPERRTCFRMAGFCEEVRARVQVPTLAFGVPLRRLVRGSHVGASQGPDCLAHLLAESLARWVATLRRARWSSQLLGTEPLHISCTLERDSGMPGICTLGRDSGMPGIHRSALARWRRSAGEGAEREDTDDTF